MVRRSLWVGLFMGFLVWSVSVASAKPKSGDPALSGRETKMLLKVDRFADQDAGLKAFWKLVRQVVTDQGLTISESANPFPGESRTRFVSFFDTKDFNLFKLGYTLRRRQNEPFTNKHQKDKKRGAKHDLTLKFRNPELLLAVLQNAKPATGLDGETTIEEDVVIGPAHNKRVYSIATKIKSDKEEGGTLRDYAKIFPGIVKLDIDEKSAIVRVNEIVVKEFTAKPGAIMLDHRTPAEVTFSVWKLNGQTQPTIVEFSYKYQISPRDALNSNIYRNGEASDRLSKSLQTLAKDWLSEGQTKTGVIYQTSAPNQE